MDSLFDQIDGVRVDRPAHSCTGELCSFCTYLDGLELRAQKEPKAEIDPKWQMQATIYRKSLAIGQTFTADNLIAAIGKPPGHANQIGSLFHFWAGAGFITAVGNTPSKREGNNGRRVQIWRRDV
jgi:hypothetical protein